MHDAAFDSYPFHVTDVSPTAGRLLPKHTPHTMLYRMGALPPTFPELEPLQVHPHVLQYVHSTYPQPCRFSASRYTIKLHITRHKQPALL
jgi:hypothetical protein